MSQHPDPARQYWNKVAPLKTFSHPLNKDWLHTFLPRPARVLDYGCGYGRLMGELQELGYQSYGVDWSEAMIARGKADQPSLPLYHLTGKNWPVPEGTFEAILLFAVLTCIPHTPDQKSLISRLRKRFIPGGLLYVSDILLQENQRNQNLYARFAEAYGTYGIFRLDDGGVMRHHDRSYLIHELLGDFDLLEEKEIPVTTMNGNPASAYQCLLRIN
ncbi:MAG: class I SAM-dependent methyltransferase [Bacteroidota bacterium]